MSVGKPFYLVGSPGCLPACLFSPHCWIFVFSISFSRFLASGIAHNDQDVLRAIISQQQLGSVRRHQPIAKLFKTGIH
ncbi:MAG: hypothetical protein BZY73_06590 [SAR202 cluster bacterium Casp-Chloro-G3]|nr:MAG: hypothetical protein BZY73_06590 [SAR202 cluster bacterium Casp-Chloro-G3]